MVIDHKDGNPANDRWENLRLATRAENSGNDRKRKTNTSGFKGVSRYKNGKWMAQIMWQRQTYWLGLHDTPEQAHTAYCQAAAKLKGEFARFG